MNNKQIAITIALVVVVLAGGALVWNKMYNNPTSSPVGTEQKPVTGEPSAPVEKVLLKTATDAKVGSYLTATNGMTLYLYTKDTEGKSTCTGQCAANWPPYLFTSPYGLVAGAGVNGTLGTTIRDDGKAQLTYKGAPLYFWKEDAKPGDVTGDGVGGVWKIVMP